MRQRLTDLGVKVRMAVSVTRVTTAGEVAGGGLITVGAWDIYRPAGLVVGGALLAFVCWLVGE